MIGALGENGVAVVKSLKNKKEKVWGFLSSSQ
jgi:hypothetical protein